MRRTSAVRTSTTGHRTRTPTPGKPTHGHDHPQRPPLQIDLPSDWTLRDNSDGVAYFEAADGSAGLYIAVWDTHITDRPVAEVLDDFVAGSVQGQDNIPGSSWSRQVTRLEESDWILDAVWADQQHRILTRYIAGLPLVLKG